MKPKYRLQQYEDGTFGYLNVDGDRYENTTTGSKVILQQSFHENREDFIENNHIEFQNNQYDSNLFKDIIIILPKDYFYFEFPKDPFLAHYHQPYRQYLKSYHQGQ